MRWLFIIGFLSVAITSYGQGPLVICKNKKIFAEPILLDSLTAWPETIQVKDGQGNSYAFHYEPGTGLLTMDSLAYGKQVEICYRTIPIILHREYMHKSQAEYRNPEKLSRKNEETQIEVLRQEELFHTDNIQKSGALTRGITMGNMQNLFVQSALNLQLEGQLTDELSIRASITDQQIPYQPEGNTARVQEFDNVMVELFTDDISLLAGDIVLRNSRPGFLQYNKNVQGALFTANHKVGKNGEAVSSVGASAAKGKFASLQLDAIEGMPGPYRIRIPGASPLAIILANSEQVFIDGKLMQRGFQRDYIIDYNRAEITFMPGVIITRFTRIRIDVEYSDQQYSRSIVAVKHQQEHKRWKAFVNVYNEQDNKFRPIGQHLDQDMMQVLSEAGDDPSKAVYSGAVPTEFNSSAVLYQKIDTLVEGQSYASIFRHVSRRVDNIYQVSFHEVGEGNGNYRLKTATANGRVYEWIAPVNNIPQGNAEPIKPLKAPDKRQMVNMGGSYNLSAHDEFFLEMAFSEVDNNLFSELDNENNKGYAFKIGYRALPREINWAKGYKLGGESYLEKLNRNFASIDRFRPVEFDRDWSVNVPVEEAGATDQIIHTGMSFKKDNEAFLEVASTQRQKDGLVNGWQHQVAAAQKLGNFRLSTQWFNMNNEAEMVNSSWQRWQANIRYMTPWVIPGYTYATDQNMIFKPGTDSIIGSAMYFHEHQFSIQSNDSLKTSFSLSHTFRTDEVPVDGNFSPFFKSQTSMARIARQVGSKHRFDMLLTWRKAENQLAESTQEPGEEAISGRINWSGNMLDNHLQSELSYGMGNGREMRRDFFYVQVPTGQGTHTWRDDNGDGIQDINEFYPAINPDERNYIRILMPTDEFVFAYDNQLNYRINADLPRSWENSGGFTAFLARFSVMSSLNASRKVTSENLLQRLLPLGSSIPDDEIMFERSQWRSVIFYNKKKTLYGAEGGFATSNNRQLHINGFEARKRDAGHIKLRYNPTQIWNFMILCQAGSERHTSDFMLDRNFQIVEQKVVPEVSWQYGSKFRLTTQANITSKVNPLSNENPEYANWREGSLELRYSSTADYMLSSRLRYASIIFEGKEQSPVGYVLLEALRPGSNITWNVVMQKRLINGLQIMIQYDARKSEGMQLIHHGNVQVSALF